jgi:conjugative transfer signal peptidase TraF
MECDAIDAAWLMGRGLRAARTASRDIVAACAEPSDVVSCYVGKGVCQGTALEPLIKPVVAVAGDTVAVTDTGVVVNGQLVVPSAPIATDGQGRALPQLVRMTVTVAMGHVWLVAPRDDAFDSRYLGPVSETAIIGE